MRAIEPAELERLHDQAYSWALTCSGGNRSEAEDILQMAYLAILDGSARFDGRSTLKTFVFGVVHRIARSMWRRMRRESARLLRGEIEAAIEARGAAEAAPAVHTDSSEHARVIAAWRALPARQRDVLDLVFYRELTIAEAAQVMGVSVGSARQHYERAKATLRERLAPRGTES
jgi:RNA polymerase sigma-70 factor (ECF subfamily)